jgi:hypothetical protein
MNDREYIMDEIENTINHIKELDIKLSETVMSKFITKEDCLDKRTYWESRIINNTRHLIRYANNFEKEILKEHKK